MGRRKKSIKLNGVKITVNGRVESSRGRKIESWVHWVVALRPTSLQRLLFRSRRKWIDFDGDLNLAIHLDFNRFHTYFLVQCLRLYALRQSQSQSKLSPSPFFLHVTHVLLSPMVTLPPYIKYSINPIHTSNYKSYYLISHSSFYSKLQHQASFPHTHLNH